MRNILDQMKTMKVTLPIQTLTVAGLLFAGVAGALAETESVEKNFAISAKGAVTIKNVNGKLTVATWDGDGVKMEAEKSASSQEGLDGIKINTKSTADSLEITTELPKKRGWFGRTKNYKAKVNYVLHVPSSVHLKKVESVNGSVSISGVKGGVNASTVNGSLTSRGLDGSIDLETVNGSVKCETYTSKSGESIEISTVNGSVELKLPKGINGNLNVKTVNGSIKSDLPFSRTDVSGRRKLRAQLGEGGVSIDLETVNGSVRLRKAAEMSVSSR